ncbi:uncharacterized protein LOC129916074 isoform X2 [Episyrphus balteatus]|uniref:uncharacterized protein LOC129916074 isoform X2 n=1 Tax=Episyrphus balteatus TaxID=286459 RepID=UPI0024861B87|nr:uncharacterized protein LOC129916074 isoform X2 [Episyrphus balteatus]
MNTKTSTTDTSSVVIAQSNSLEVVEEFGCHDTELRLTCGNLDSKLAILEATFTPNCTHDECLRLDMKRLVRTFASEEIEESKNAEKEAGEKFLETLRQSPHSNEEDTDVDILEDGNFTDGKTNRIKTNGQNKNRTSLRLVLERLIIRYLRRISPEEELEGGRFSRSLHNSTPEETTPNIPSVILNETIEAVQDEDSIRTQSARSHCEEQGRQISSLNRLDLEKSYRNQSANEYNIRRVLNKRCSGKNHCSFIFSIDHPFAKVWEGGVVRVKYICMEDFRINRYCGEHLTIGYEIDPNIQILDNAKGDPKAEARLQPRETALHSLKIIKADKISNADNMRNSTISGLRKLKNPVPYVKQEETPTEGQKSRIYSQDFRVLKILPSNLDDFNDIETIGDEIFFKKEDISTEHVMSVNEPSSTTTSNYNDLETTAATPKSETDILDETIKINNLDNKTIIESENLENVTMVIRKGAHYITVYPNDNSTVQNVSVHLSGNDIRHTNDELKLTHQEVSSTIEPKKEIEIVKDENHEIDEKHEDISDEEENSRVTYNSIQRTSYRSPLLHGFAMTPGYPKFYIGEFDCHWDILAPEGIRIWVTIIDNSLRFDDICKDFLQIDDFGTNTTLFNSCVEAVQPVGVMSTSNWVKIIVKTTSKFAFPKRGVLLHYTADSCVNPPLPTHVKLVERTPTTAFYECHPSFLFPDSGLSTRKLTCNNIHVWDKLLPDCTEQENLTGSEEKLTLISKKPDLSVVTKMPSKNDADMITDIIIPCVLIAGLFIINGAIFAVIMKYRNRSKTVEDGGVELAEL